MTENEYAKVTETFQQMAALQARVCYMNVDRTLATWTRTALSLIVFGTVVNRYGILLTRAHLTHVGTPLAPNPVSSIGGLILIAMGVFIVAAAAIRHQGYRVLWLRKYGHDKNFGPWLAFPFAVMVMLLGVAMLLLLVALA
ncbi:MAG TPA: DUF202 domain-containing protein [Rhodanobacteraceae bacterium]